MKCLKSLVCFGLLLFMLCSCSSVAVKAFDRYEDVKTANIETAKQATQKMLDSWLFYSGVIHGALGTFEKHMPQQTVEAMKELDLLAIKNADIGLSDQELGRALGVRIQVLGGTIKEAINQYAPNVFRYLPVFP